MATFHPHVEGDLLHAGPSRRFWVEQGRHQPPRALGKVCREEPAVERGQAGRSHVIVPIRTTTCRHTRR